MFPQSLFYVEFPVACWLKVCGNGCLKFTQDLKICVFNANFCTKFCNSKFLNTIYRKLNL